MIDVQTIIDLFLTPELISSMGQCAYQRTLFVLSVALPVLELSVGFAFLFLLAYGIFKAVTKS